MGFTPHPSLPLRTPPPPPPPTLHFYLFFFPLPSPPPLWCPQPLHLCLSGYIVSNLSELTLALLSSKALIGV